MSDLTEAERLALQAHARRSLEDQDAARSGEARSGEARWHYKPGKWDADDLIALEKRGLIVVRREWKDNWVRLTDAGYHALGAAA